MRGDGRLTVLFTPGHTPGHLSMLVQPAQREAYVLTGDLVHSTAPADDRASPPETIPTRFAARLEIERVIAARRSAPARQIIVGHDPTIIALLPAFPKAAE